MPYEKFKCESCGFIFNMGKLAHRHSMPGQYCNVCADKEKCAACGELSPKAMITFMNDVKNYICDDCQHDYKCVADYIKPLFNFSEEHVVRRLQVVRPLHTNDKQINNELQFSSEIKNV